VVRPAEPAIDGLRGIEQAFVVEEVGVGAAERELRGIAVVEVLLPVDRDRGVQELLVRAAVDMLPEVVAEVAEE
jgi:hypothetical protein